MRQTFGSIYWIRDEVFDIEQGCMPMAECIGIVANVQAGLA